MAPDLEQLTDLDLSLRLVAMELDKRTMESFVDRLLGAIAMPQPILDEFKRNLNFVELEKLIAVGYRQHFSRETMIGAVRFLESEHGALYRENRLKAAESVHPITELWGKLAMEGALRKFGLEP